MAYVRVRLSSVVVKRGVVGTPPAKCGRSKSAGTEEDGEKEKGQTSSKMHQSEGTERVMISGSNSSVDNPMRQESGMPFEDDKNGEKLLDLKSSEPSRLDQTNNTPNVSLSLTVDDPSSVCMLQKGSKFNKGRRFDLSSVAGQWYHISDSHVSAVSENRVLGSQAYLLFYERLPLIKNTSSS